MADTIKDSLTAASLALMAQSVGIFMALSVLCWPAAGRWARVICESARHGARQAEGSDSERLTHGLVWRMLRHTVLSLWGDQPANNKDTDVKQTSRPLAKTICLMSATRYLFCVSYKYFTPLSYISHWLMVLLFIRLKIKRIVSYSLSRVSIVANDANWAMA